jgi:hypothetical protein
VYLARAFEHAPPTCRALARSLDKGIALSFYYGKVGLSRKQR